MASLAARRPGRRRGRDTRNDIVAAAQVCFLRHGYAAVSMDDVARQAGVIKQTVYRYFPGKAELFTMVMVDYCRRFGVDDIGHGTDRLPVDEALRRIAVRLIGMHATPEAIALYRVVVSEAHRFPELAQAFSAGGPDGVRRQLASLLASRHAAGELAVPDPVSAAEHLLAALISPWQLRLCLGSESAPTAGALEAAATATVTLFLDGARAASAGA